MASLSLPGFVNAHSHAFQRALRGRDGGRRLLGLARRDAGPGPGTVPREMSGTRYVHVYREMLDAGYTAVGEFHYLGFDAALAAAEAAEEAGIELVLLYAAYAVRHALRAAVGRRVPRRGRAAARARAERRRRSPLRPRLPAGMARGDRPLRRARGTRAARARVRAAARDRGVPRGVRRPPDRAARAKRLSRRRARPSCTRRMRAMRSSTSSTTPVRVSASVRRPRRISETASRRSTASALAASASASARTRTCASILSRSCASSRAPRAGSRCAANIVPLERLLAFGSDEGAAALGIERWPDVVVDTRTRRSPESTKRTC